MEFHRVEIVSDALECDHARGMLHRGYGLHLHLHRAQPTALLYPIMVPRCTRSRGTAMVGQGTGTDWPLSRRRHDGAWRAKI